MASDTTTAAAAAEEAEAVEEYDSDPDEVKRSLAMRRREASDEEVEEDKDSELPIVQSVHIPAGSRGCGAPAEYDDEEEEEEHDRELEEEDEEGDVYEAVEEEEVYEEEERNDGAVKVKGIEAEEGMEEEKKESNEPFAQQLGLFIWDNVAGRHRISSFGFGLSLKMATDYAARFITGIILWLRKGHSLSAALKCSRVFGFKTVRRLLQCKAVAV
ncbi:hypothetical protein KPL70_020571 [Citrus sinensis]|uniref:Uncharacterized protein n=1 Tax=Citrus sinensis TaxID=2711 RepID=A0ACB8JA82_CITSI|nr:hypothetical protein KPL70_020571 [Citrus sinensis]KAH9714588.1 hypothetical protein KPL71_020709 [Citrus sinensis]